MIRLVIALCAYFAFASSASASCAYDLGNVKEFSRESPAEGYADDPTPLLDLKYVDATALGFTPHVEDVVFRQFAKLTVITKLTDPRDNSLIARFSYDVDPSTPHMMETADLHIARQDIGLTRELFSRALRQHPHVAQIREYLVGENAAQARKNLKTMTCAEALANTPIMRMIQGLGFRRTVTAVCDTRKSGEGLFIVQGL